MKAVNYILSIGIAAGAGWIAGILTAPRKGKDTRHQILSEAETLKSQIESETNRKLNEAKSILQRTAKGYENNTREAVKDLKEVVTE